MKKYTFFTKTEQEGIKEHKIKSESCKKAYELLKASGYPADTITMTGYKGV